MLSPGGKTQISCDSSEPSGQFGVLSQSCSSEIHTAVVSEHINSLRGQTVCIITYSELDFQVYILFISNLHK